MQRALHAPWAPWPQSFTRPDDAAAWRLRSCCRPCARCCGMASAQGFGLSSWELSCWCAWHGRSSFGVCPRLCCTYHDLSFCEAKDFIPRVGAGAGSVERG